jgi:hypothetical protein
MVPLVSQGMLAKEEARPVLRDDDGRDGGCEKLKSI